MKFRFSPHIRRSVDFLLPVVLLIRLPGKAQCWFQKRGAMTGTSIWSGLVRGRRTCCFDIDFIRKRPTLAQWDNRTVRLRTRRERYSSSLLTCFSSLRVYISLFTEGCSGDGQRPFYLGVGAARTVTVKHARTLRSIFCLSAKTGFLKLILQFSAIPSPYYERLQSLQLHALFRH